jgi:hypothetical protein
VRGHDDRDRIGQKETAMQWRWLGLAALVAASGTSHAQDASTLQVHGPKPLSRATLQLCEDAECKKPHALGSVPASGVPFPLPVLELAPNGAVRAEIPVGGKPATVWLRPTEIRTGLKTEGSCLLAQRSPGPIGATRGANEGCLPPASGERK